MSKTVLTGRADLLRALAEAPIGERPLIAALLGFHAPLKSGPNKGPGPGGDASGSVTGTGDEPYAATVVVQRSSRRLPVPMWCPISYRLLPRSKSGKIAPIVWRHRPTKPPTFEPLATWPDLWPRLVRLLSVARPIGDLDVDRIVEGLSAARLPDPLPLHAERSWPSQIHVIVDRSDRLTPFWCDQSILLAALRDHFGDREFRVARMDGSMSEPRFLEDGAGYTPPPPGGVALVLGDLGCLDRHHAAATRPWLGLGQRIRAAGARPAALFPAPLARCFSMLKQIWRVEAWEGVAENMDCDSDELRRRADRLLGFLSSCLRVEPGLLRSVRRCLPPSLADAGTEADVWQHRAIASPHVVAATLDRSAMPAPPGERDHRLWTPVLARRRAWRHALPDEIWFLELLGLPDGVRAEVYSREDMEDAQAFFRTLDEAPGLVGCDRSAVDEWLIEASELAARPALDDQNVKAAMANSLLRQSARGRIDHDTDLTRVRPLGPERLLSVWQQGDRFVLREADDPTDTAGSPISPIRSAIERVQIIPVPADGDRYRPDIPTRPSWATGFGADEFGYWASFSISGFGVSATQRLRWCRPGQFAMGSPSTECGRFDDEGPQRTVTVAEGFWLFDTPCTQALWHAVMGDNPNQSQGPDLPIVNVSFLDVERFLGRINLSAPGLDLELPSEARWEYACRAGTSEATYAGELPSGDLGQRRLLNPIAWWAANSRGKLHPVKRKRANAWGLCDMLGNAWEWCADHWHDSYEGAPTDGSAWLSRGGAAGRVVRGGSWGDDARYVRAACRNGGEPTLRLADLGFRCARVQVSDERETERVAASADPASRPSAERGRPQGPTSGATLLRVGGADVARLKRGSSLLIRTDREEVQVRRVSCDDPDLSWANNGLGRDRYGLFAEFTLPDTEITQRLRWIPPGRFVMGSPVDEPGRWEDEGPQHEVTLTDGFWLFDTPCTQSLWQAVMGNNPCRFRSPDRPVESVDIADVRRFLAEVNGQVPGLELCLPSEAQWEYACRAGTQTATYAGPLEILGESNAPVLDAIAWYGGNSGVGPDVEDAADSRAWPDKQYLHEGAATHPVKQKRANAWGLYDMLGNVWEWCADNWRGSYEGAPTDGSAWLSRGGAAFRVVRGGSWVFDARLVRAACRDWREPSSRDDNLGFRCARAHERVGVSAPEQARFQGVTSVLRVRRNMTAAGVLVAGPDGAAKARRPVGVGG